MADLENCMFGFDTKRCSCTPTDVQPVNTTNAAEPDSINLTTRFRWVEGPTSLRTGASVVLVATK